MQMLCNWFKIFGASSKKIILPLSAPLIGLRSYQPDQLENFTGKNNFHHCLISLGNGNY